MADAAPEFFETLEHRRLFSSMTLGGAGLLTVRADAGAANTITVEFGSNQLSVDVMVSSVTGRGVTRTASKSFPRTLSITKVLVVGSSKSNIISVGTIGAFLIPTEVDGHGASDQITVGDQPATLSGGRGDTTIMAGNGDDVIVGGSGANRITVGDGNDAIRGGNHGNTINAGDGRDTIVGGNGADAIHVGDGNDLVFGLGGKDVIVAGEGNDTIWGGSGNDQITTGNGNDVLGDVSGRNTLIGGTGHNTFLLRTLKAQTINYDPAKDTLIVPTTREPAVPKI